MIGDIVFHVLCVAMAALCAVGGVVAAEGPGRWISFATGVVFLFGIALLWLHRWRLRRADYVTRYGLRIRLGKVNSPTKLQVDRWTLSLLEHWDHSYVPDKVRKAIEGHIVVFYDQEKLSVLGRWVAGLTTTLASAIGVRLLGNGKPDYEYVRRLFQHEVSHTVLNAFEPWDETLHHDIFERSGLNAL